MEPGGNDQLGTSRMGITEQQMGLGLRGRGVIGRLSGRIHQGQCLPCQGARRRRVTRYQMQGCCIDRRKIGPVLIGDPLVGDRRGLRQVPPLILGGGGQRLVLQDPCPKRSGVLGLDIGEAQLDEPSLSL